MNSTVHVIDAGASLFSSHIRLSMRIENGAECLTVRRERIIQESDKNYFSDLMTSYQRSGEVGAGVSSIC